MADIFNGVIICMNYEVISNEFLHTLTAKYNNPKLDVKMVWCKFVTLRKIKNTYQLRTNGVACLVFKNSNSGYGPTISSYMNLIFPVLYKNIITDRKTNYYLLNLTPIYYL